MPAVLCPNSGMGVAARGDVTQGALRVLEAVGAEPGVRQSVLTGNLRSIAELKMRAFTLERFVDFEIGAYGEDHVDRAHLVDLACERASLEAGEKITAEETLLIGDTELDILAAHDSGASVLAVATGKFTAAELMDSGADMVLSDLSDTAAVLAFIRGGAASVRAG